MNQIKYLIIIGLILGNQAAASIGTITGTSTEKLLTSTSTSAIEELAPVATTTLPLPKVSTSSITARASSTSASTASSTSITATTSDVQETPAAKIDDNLAKLFGSVDPISLNIASTSTTTDESSIVIDDASTTVGSNEAQQSDIANGINQQANTATSEPQSLIASFKYLSSNVVIQLLGSLALIFLLAAIIFLLLAKRYDRRDINVNE